LSLRLTGWFQVGWSSTVPPDEVVQLRYFGQDLVAWRDRAGAVHVLDAYCQHLGANLARGGCITDGGIQCPFHGWEWNAEGRNISIPYQDRPNTARRIRAWSVVERDEVLYLWHDVSGRAPLFDVPDRRAVSEHLAGVVLDSALPDGTSRYTDLQIHPQFVVENAVDPQHFRFVHHTPLAPVVLKEDVTDFTWLTVAGFGRRWADGVYRADDRRNTITILWVGMGVSFNAEQTEDGWRVICISTTPVDDQTTEMFGTYWLENQPGGTPEDRVRRLDLIKNALPEDLEIWNHQIYLDPPGLATSEGAGFRKMRRWTRKFYPDGGPLLAGMESEQDPDQARLASNVGLA
jgi:3-ketosteroid 9alpha-monooxygenase subunit A